ncbi:hypothetical protein LMTR3_21210 [Bradyrhizobium sp. LMTR 3]|nr:hypothetical protein LMTR3_21210 [Bradyrhizobium sp. LMTR 3]
MDHDASRPPDLLSRRLHYRTPKVTIGEIIAQTEGVAREVNYGAIGFYGNMETDITMPTVTVNDGLARV